MSTQGSQTWQKWWEWHVKNRILVLGGQMKGPATPLPVGEPPTPRRRPWLLHLGASALSPARPSLASVSPLLYSHFPFLRLFKVKRKVICSCGSSFREVVTQGPLEASSNVAAGPVRDSHRPSITSVLTILTLQSQPRGLDVSGGALQWWLQNFIWEKLSLVQGLG